MKIERTFTPTGFKTAIEVAKHEGHEFKGMTWDAACFADLIITREYESEHENICEVIK